MRKKTPIFHYEFAQLSHHGPVIDRYGENKSRAQLRLWTEFRSRHSGKHHRIGVNPRKVSPFAIFLSRKIRKSDFHREGTRIKEARNSVYKCGNVNIFYIGIRTLNHRDGNFPIFHVNFHVLFMHP